MTHDEVEALKVRTIKRVFAVLLPLAAVALGALAVLIHFEPKWIAPEIPIALACFGGGVIMAGVFVLGLRAWALVMTAAFAIAFWAVERITATLRRALSPS